MSCFEKIFVLGYLNRMVTGEEPEVGLELTQLIAGICDLRKGSAGGRGSGQV